MSLQPQGPDKLSNPSAFRQGPMESAALHAFADKDQGSNALHHTLGDGADQAAPGNHTHAVNFVTALPVASSSYRGKFYIVKGDGATTSDTVHVCILTSAGTYAWKTVTIA